MRQKPREFATKFGKAIDIFFHKGFPEAEAVLAKWITYLDEVALSAPDDPLFPATAISAKGHDGFKATGCIDRRWSAPNRSARSSTPLSDRRGMNHTGHVPSATCIHATFRGPAKTSPMLIAASQNLGHGDVLTTLRSFEQISREDQRRPVTGEEREDDEE
ncbi:hypothetical protein [uncultured Tateyamaria sp.]|uniref:hypothetical protein n=1 Tax=uncultured Tateyamaria sp. TaxID=455651 RepID=UPI0026298345|nr:hypothetical protein [uncultured Tateyamaria sp.]